jgi:para-aminobenzoate synthetase component I
MLSWASRFNICAFLDNHHYADGPQRYECMVGAGAIKQLSQPAGRAFDALQQWADAEGDWLFGHLGYELKSETAQLPAAHPDRIGFPDLFFFVPKVVLWIKDNHLHIGSLIQNHASLFNEITNTIPPAPVPHLPLYIHPRMSRSDYLHTIAQLQQHIHRGDCYEINYCQEFFAENAVIDPVTVFQALGKVSPNPFAAFYRVADSYLLCASPERYLQKKGNRLISQPIKGTTTRNHDDPQADSANKNALLTSVKERAENVMVVDLVRNDLSRVCAEGTVKVDELYGLYSFPQVHQMISTISGELSPEHHWTAALKASFPMGSMTGAPKKRVMQLIEQYETSRRGIFAGAVGYISPERDFDFNVVIRSILYNSSTNYLSYLAGSGITFYSDAEKEYEECMLKAKAMAWALGGSPPVQ